MMKTKRRLLADWKYSSILDDDINALFECYLTLPEIPDPAHNPFSYSGMCEQQQQVQQLLALQAKYPEQYMYKTLAKDLDTIIC